ncbi:hypothetical protein V5030_12705 [Moellerella wisconsensis]|uniref:hypothetical protein n=1 Tax=Moellerella wisconsensis TaxID=158849 RepID=UPI003076586F
MEFLYSIDQKTKERFVIIGYQCDLSSSDDKEQKTLSQYNKVLSKINSIESPAVGKDAMLLISKNRNEASDKVDKLFNKLFSGINDELDFEKAKEKLVETKNGRRWKKAHEGMIASFNKSTDASSIGGKRQIADWNKLEKRAKKIINGANCKSVNAAIIAKFERDDSLSVLFVDEQMISDFYHSHNRVPDFKNLLCEGLLVEDAFLCCQPRFGKYNFDVNLSHSSGGVVKNKVTVHFLHGESYIDDNGCIQVGG